MTKTLRALLALMGLATSVYAVPIPQVMPGSPFGQGTGGGGTPGTGCIPSGATGLVQYSDGSGACLNESAFIYNSTTDALSIITATGAFKVGGGAGVSATSTYGNAATTFVNTAGSSGVTTTYTGTLTALRTITISATASGITQDLDTGAWIYPDQISMGSGIVFTADVSPSQITADQDNYTGCAVATNSRCRLTTDASRTITSVAAGADGIRFVACNVGSFNVVFEDDSASGTAANRFALGANLTLAADQCASFTYDATTSRWRHDETSSGGSGTPGGNTTEVQFNAAGSFQGASGLIYNDTTDETSFFGAEGAANTITLGSNMIESEGATANAFETSIIFGDHTVDRSLTITGTSAGVVFDASSGAWVVFEEPIQVMTSAVADPVTANSASFGGNGIVWEGSTANGAETTLGAADPGTDTTVNVPALPTAGTYTIQAGQSGTADPPATCQAGNQFYLETDTNELYGCVAANTWELLNGGGSGSGTVTSVAVDAQEFAVTDPSAAADIARVPCYAAGNATGATTLNFNNGLCQGITLTGNTTLTFTNPLNGGFHVVSATQDGTGSRTITWPGSVVWSSELAQVPLATATKTTHFLFMYDGTSFLGFSLNAGSSVWSNLGNPTSNIAMSMAANSTAWECGDFGSGSSVPCFTFRGDSGNIGGGPVASFQTESGAPNYPWEALAGGTSNGVTVNVSGVLARVGTGRVQGQLPACADAGSTDTYACSPSPSIIAYDTRACYVFTANTANTGAASINLNALGAKAIVKVAGGITTALATNDIRVGQVVLVCYDGTNMQMQSTLGNAPSGGSGGNVPNTVMGGRLTLTTAVPVTTADVTGATTIYYTPYVGNQISLYDGAAWALHTFTERTCALGTLTADKQYDVFLYDNAGTITCEFSAAWTNDTTRADALAFQDGALVKSGTTTRRYVGTFRTTSTTATEDSGGGSTTQVGGKRFLWNMYNRVPSWARVIDTADSWVYNTATWRVANGATGPLNCNQLVIGYAGPTVQSDLLVLGYDGDAQGQFAGVSLNSTSAPSGLVSQRLGNDVGSEMSAKYTTTPALGYHYSCWMERGAGGSTAQWNGDSGLSGVTQSGMETTSQR